MCKPADPEAIRRFCLLMRLDIELADGTTQTIVTDPSWQATTDGPIRRAGIYFGETYDATQGDARLGPARFRRRRLAAGRRCCRTRATPRSAALVAQCNEPIRVVEELRPVKMTEPKPGVYVFDMGQNMVGWCRLKANAPAGTKVNVRHAEMLNDDGTIYTANLRGAAQINEYTLARRRGRAGTAFHLSRLSLRRADRPARPAGQRRRRRPGVPLGRARGRHVLLFQRVAQQDHALRRMGAAGEHDERAHRLPAARRSG